MGVHPLHDDIIMVREFSLALQIILSCNEVVIDLAGIRAMARIRTSTKVRVLLPNQYPHPSFNAACLR